VKRDTLVFHGTEDHAVSIHYARRLAASNPKTVQLVELAGVGHMLPHVAPETIIAAIDELAKVANSE